MSHALRVTEDPAAVPTWLIVMITVGIPVGVIAILFYGANRDQRERLAYRCVRCGATFSLRAHEAFPETCPACGARDWNVTSAGGPPA
jgi:hypothetical protein